MELLKSKTILKQFSVFRKEDFAMNSSYLWIWNPADIPPHMGLSVDGRYFSLKANGLDLGSKLEDIIGLISRKKMPVLAVNLDHAFSVSDCVAEFSKYDKTIAHEITCLNPIKSVLNFEQAKKLSELLMEIEEKGIQGEITAWNIDEDSIELAEYSTEDIHKYLVSLSK